MSQQPTIGNNRTTRSEHPEMYEEMEKGTEEFGPTSEGDGTKLRICKKCGRELD